MAPKIITETIKGKPRVITQVINQHIRNQIVHQPYVNNTEIKIRPNFIKQKDQFIQNDTITQPTKYTNKRNSRTINVEGDIYNNYSEVQNTEIREKVNAQLVPSQEIRRTDAARYEPVVTKNNSSVR